MAGQYVLVQNAKLIHQLCTFMWQCCRSQT